MNEQYQPNNDPSDDVSHHESSDQDNSGSLLQKILAQGADTSRFDRLRYIMNTNEEEGRKYLRELAMGMAREDARFQDNIARMKTRPRDTEQERIKEQQQAILHEYMHVIGEMAQLPGEQSTDAIGAARESIKKRLEDSAVDVQGMDTQELLRLLGIMEGEGDATQFVYPSDLFPPEVNAKMSAYLDSVEQHVASVATTPREITGRLDKTRRLNHDAIARDIAQIIFSDMEKEHAFTEARKLVAKWRDGAIPNSGEQVVVGIALKNAYGKAALFLSDTP